MIRIQVRQGVVFSVDAPYVPFRGFDMAEAVETRVGTVVKDNTTKSWGEYEGPWSFVAEVPLSQENLIKVFHLIEGLNARSKVYAECTLQPADLTFPEHLT
jgi:hypothetical protein